MKKQTIIIFVIISFIFSACNHENMIIITGHVENGERDYLSIKETYTPSLGFVDSTRIKKSGNFNFKIKSDKLMFLEINYHPQNILLIAHPGETIKLNIPGLNSSSSYIVSGSKDSESIKYLNDKLIETKHVIDSLKSISEEKISEIETQINTVISEHKNFIISYILKDMKSLTNITALNQKLSADHYIMNSLRDIQYFKIVNDSLIKYYPKLPSVKLFSSNTEALISNYNQIRILSQVKEIKSTLPDIRLPDRKNDSIDLSSLKGKMVLLYFWSPIIKDNLILTRQLFSIYKSYKAKGFEIYQVAFEGDFERWSSVIKFEEIPWISVFDNRGSYSSYLGIYNVSKFPTTYLIDKSQEKILGKNLSIKQLDLKLNYLLNN